MDWMKILREDYRAKQNSLGAAKDHLERALSGIGDVDIMACLCNVERLSQELGEIAIAIISLGISLEDI